MTDLNPYEEGLALELKAAQERIEALIAEVERVTAINAKHCNAVNTLLIDGARLEERAKKAEAERDALEAKLAKAVDRGRSVASFWNEAIDEALDILDEEGWLGESRERIELLKKN